MYQSKGILVNISKHMLPSVVPKVLKKLHNIPHFQKAPIHAFEIQTPSDHNSFLVYGIFIIILNLFKLQIFHTRKSKQLQVFS